VRVWRWEKQTLSKKVFEGIKILDFGWAIAGPLTLKYLADYGATVICIESFQRPDLLRTATPYKEEVPGVDRAGYFAYFAANKYSISLNLNKPNGLNIAKKLVTWADIVADSHRPGVMERWKLGYDDLVKIQPDIIMVRNSNQGLTGPAATHPGLGNHIIGLTGIVNLVGYPGKEPISLMVAYSDYLVPHFAAAALIGALDYRRKTGKGQLLDISQFEVGLQLLTPALLNYSINGLEEKPKGNSCDYAAPHGVFRCKGDDRWCTISVFDDLEWQAFCDAIGKPNWSKEPEYSNLRGRKENEARLNKLIEQWTIQHEAEEVVKLLQKAGVAAGVVQNAKDLYDDIQLKERECFWVADHKELGKFSHLGQPSRLSKTAAKFYHAAPCLGEHTEYVCRGLLGMSQTEYDEYLVEGIFE
jgi:crotonobetainyl-CoA:carnitine CoA-transferase CaiB-like acyl-CoA transferase